MTNNFIANVNYHKNEERVFLTLYRTALTSGGEELNKFYELRSEEGDKTWTLTFDNERGNVGEGTVNIDDDLIQTVSIGKTQSKTSIVVTAKEKVRLVIYTQYVIEQNLLETTVSIVRPAAASETAVVIDGGHGGHDSGAVGLSGRYEKDFNLDIAIKLKERLVQNGGFRVFLTRDGDYFVDLYERAELANALNADLFVSIHANASSTNPDANGIETLFCPTGAAADADAGVFSSRLFAEIMQRRLIATLKTTDRGIVERPNLVVLRKTDMPAILVETAFVTNKNDLLNLTRSAYRKNAADAIADSVMEALHMLNKR